MGSFFKRRDASSGAAVASITPPKKRRRRKLIKGTTIFICLMLLYPIAQFAIMWFGVNINSILLTFKEGITNEFRPADELFYNYETVFMEIASNSTWQSIYIASAAYIVLNCFVTLPVSMFFSYFVFKKVYAAGVFKAIFYLPSVLPIVALTTVYTLAFQQSSDATGFMGSFFALFGVDTSTWFIGDGAKWMVWVFCFWTGIGYDVMLMSAAMARIPRELLESAKMDGISPLKEFFYIVIPLSWPTVTTLFIFAMLGFFGTYLQPMLLTLGQYDTMTLGLQIFYEADVPNKVHAATVGLVWTLIGAPIILGVRTLLNHFFKEVNF